VRADDIMNRIGEGFGARRVFGQPVERDGVTVIPVAMVGGGGGGGAAGGAEGTPGGAGFGGWSRGIGVFVLQARLTETHGPLPAVATASMGSPGA
jgi:uncharacterized spore protein YtfJ